VTAPRFFPRWLCRPDRIGLMRLSPTVLFAVLAALAGCQRGSARPPTVPVKVDVSYRNRPVSGATVTFLPVGGPRGAVGRTNAKGRALLRTFAADDGALPGRYRVTIDKFVDASGPADASQEEYEKFWAAQKQGPAGLPPLKCELPWKYGQVEKTGLTADVQERGENTFRFDLVD